MYSIPSGFGPNIVVVISVQIYVSKWSLKQRVSTVRNVGLGVGLNIHFHYSWWIQTFASSENF